MRKGDWFNAYGKKIGNKAHDCPCVYVRLSKNKRIIHATGRAFGPNPTGKYERTFPLDEFDIEVIK